METNFKKNLIPIIVFLIFNLHLLFPVQSFAEPPDNDDSIATAMETLERFFGESVRKAVQTAEDFDAIREAIKTLQAGFSTATAVPDNFLEIMTALKEARLIDESVVLALEEEATARIANANNIVVGANAELRELRLLVQAGLKNMGGTIRTERERAEEEREESRRRRSLEAAIDTLQKNLPQASNIPADLPATLLYLVPSSSGTTVSEIRVATRLAASIAKYSKDKGTADEGTKLLASYGRTSSYLPLRAYVVNKLHEIGSEQAYIELCGFLNDIVTRAKRDNLDFDMGAEMTDVETEGRFFIERRVGAIEIMKHVAHISELVIQWEGGFETGGEGPGRVEGGAAMTIHADDSTSPEHRIPDEVARIQQEIAGHIIRQIIDFLDYKVSELLVYLRSPYAGTYKDNIRKAKKEISEEIGVILSIVRKYRPVISAKDRSTLLKAVRRVPMPGYYGSAVGKKALPRLLSGPKIKSSRRKMEGTISVPRGALVKAVRGDIDKATASGDSASRESWVQKALDALTGRDRSEGRGRTTRSRR